MNASVHPVGKNELEAPKRPPRQPFHTSPAALLAASLLPIPTSDSMATRTQSTQFSLCQALQQSSPNLLPEPLFVLQLLVKRLQLQLPRYRLHLCRRDREVIAITMTTRGSSEVLKDAGDHMVDMEDMFGNPKKEWRNPLVLCGAVATAGVLVAGLASFRQGNFRTSQMLMRTRVVFQAGTVALMAGTVYFQGKS